MDAGRQLNIDSERIMGIQMNYIYEEVEVNSTKMFNFKSYMHVLSASEKIFDELFHIT